MENVFRIEVAAGSTWFFVGLDLGQSRDHTALVVVESAEILLAEFNYVTYERPRKPRLRVRFVERVPLGTPYPNVVARVREVVRSPPLAGRCTLVVDATGLGAPVLDMLRQANLGCPIEGVVLTNGEQETKAGNNWHVPKRDLIAGLRMMLEKRELGISGNVRSARLLGKELMAMETRESGRGGARMGVWRAGEHDDLTIAVALACWRSQRKRIEWGTRSLGLGYG